MAIIDRVKFDGLNNREWLIYRHPSESLVMGTQLIVGEGQAAIFVRGGQICDLFMPGTYSLSTANLPILNGLVNLPFGGKTPFTAEIYYLNTTTKMDILWGTSDPIQLIDPKFFVKLRVRAFGQLAFKVADYSTFMRELIGTLKADQLVRFDKIIDYYKGIVIQRLKVIVSSIIINEKISALEITPRLDYISEKTLEKLSPEFAGFGLKIINFMINSVNFPDEDFKAINEILSKRAEFEIMGDNRYSTMRTFDVYEGAANNSSGIAGAFVAGGIGLGAGAAMANQAPNILTNTSPSYKECPSCHYRNASDAQFCASCGKTYAAGSLKCPSCSGDVYPESKFCPSCGTSLEPKKCSDCGAELSPTSKFCSLCGTHVE